MTLSAKRKADLAATVAIAVALPGYYKVKYLLDGQLQLADLWQVSALLEVVFAFCLAVLLISLYRAGEELAARHPRLMPRRLSLVLLVGLAALTAVVFSRFFFNVVVDWGSAASFEFDLVVLAVLLPLIVSGIADRVFLANAARDAERAELAARIEILKARLSPHFLFNSLNSLVDIIEEDQELAVRFVEEMAAIYRYILDSRDLNVVPVQAELDAVSSLVYLLETRHPGAIAFDCRLPPEVTGRHIVPLTLQTLVENALKHNLYSAQEPLRLRIYASDSDLVVENTLNLRAGQHSTAMGLENLARRVEHTCDRQIIVDRSEELFSVRVPLLA